MRSIWDTERTGKACVRASSALGSSGENIVLPNLQDGCPSPENNPTASAHAFLEMFPFYTTAAIWRLMQMNRPNPQPPVEAFFVQAPGNERSELSQGTVVRDRLGLLPGDLGKDGAIRKGERPLSISLYCHIVSENARNSSRMAS